MIKKNNILEPLSVWFKDVSEDNYRYFFVKEKSDFF